MDKAAAKKSFFLFNTFRSTAFIVPILFIYLNNELGLSIQKILILAGFYSLIPFVLEVPLGLIADKVGDKRVLVVSLLCQIISCLSLLLLSEDASYHIYLISIYVAGAAYSGADKTLIHQHIPNDSEFKNFLLDLNAKFYKYTIVFLLIGSATYQFDSRLPFIIQSLSFCIALFAIARVTDKKSMRTNKKNRDGGTLSSALLFLFKDPAYLSVSLIAAIFSASILMNQKTIQLIYTNSLESYFSLNPIWTLGVFYAIGNLMSYQGLEFYRKLKLHELPLHRQNIIFTLMLSASFILFSFELPVFILIGFLLINVFKSIYRPLLSAELTTKIPFSKYKTTILSIAALLSAVVSAGIHVGFSSVFQDLSAGNSVYISIVAPILFGLILIACKKFSWKIFIFNKPLTGKKNFIMQVKDKRYFVQEYPDEVDNHHFNQMAWVLEKTRYPHSITNISKGKVTAEFLSEELLLDLSKDEQKVVLDEFFAHFMFTAFTRQAPEYISPVVGDIESISFPPEISKKLKADKYWTIVHGDLHPENLIIVERRKLILIDWDLSGQGWVWQDLLTLLTSPYLKIQTKLRRDYFEKIMTDLNANEVNSVFKAFLDFKVRQLEGFIELDPSFEKIHKDYLSLRSEWR